MSSASTLSARVAHSAGVRAPGGARRSFRATRIVSRAVAEDESSSSAVYQPAVAPEQPSGADVNAAAKKRLLAVAAASGRGLDATPAQKTAASSLIAELIAANQGGALTSAAMGSVVSWFPMLLSIAVVLFAFSTMISWSYYGERCWAFMFGDGSSMIYRIIFLCCTFLGSLVTATNILDFSDLMVLGMAFPNVVGVVLLSANVKKDLAEYERKLESGEIAPIS